MIAIAGCAHGPRRVGLGLPAPNPNGCYIFVYDRPDWKGAGAVLNGPARWPSLERLLANEENWRNRIRSIHVGPAATLTAYTDAAFRGASRQLAPNSQNPRLDSELSARIESLELACRPGVSKSRSGGTTRHETTQHIRTNTTQRPVLLPAMGGPSP